LRPVGGGNALSRSGDAVACQSATELAIAVLGLLGELVLGHRCTSFSE
jgi:hypothetical protein